MRKTVSCIAALFLAACSGGGNPAATGMSQAAGTSQATGTSTATGASTTTGDTPAATTTATSSVNGAPTIYGQPVTALNANTAYAFLPTVSGAAGETLVFSIQNKPSWATFDTSTGELAGTPNSTNVGTYDGILISVSNGIATTALSAFNISVTQISNGSVTLSWLPPTTNTNGTALTNLAGYKIYYGTSPSSMTHSLQITSPSVAIYMIGNLSPATWYFSLVSYNSAEVESPLSAIVSKTIVS